MKKINMLALVLLITGAIDSIRNLPTTALFGSSLIFFCLFAAVVFLIPTALVSAELSAKFPEKSGVFHWAKLAFGSHTAFAIVWLQWINTMVWYPTMLAFIAATAGYLIDPSIMHNNYDLVVIMLVVFWGQTLINLKGLHLSARFAAICTVFGMVIPMIAIIMLGAVWLISAMPSHIHFTLKALIPNFTRGENWISLTAIMASYLGMELAAVHVNDVKNPQHNFPKALLFSVVIILFTVILGSLAIAVVLPNARISLVGGVLQAFQAFLQAYHLGFLLPVLVVMVLIGSVGGLTNWVISPAKGLLQGAECGFLPAWLSKTNQHGVAKNILVLQAVLVSIIAMAFLFLPSINGSYWLLTDISTQLYILMYVLLFLSAIKISVKFSHIKSAFSVKGGKYAVTAVSLLGLFGCTVSIIVGFIPPQSINVGTPFHFILSFCIGMVVMLLPLQGFYYYKKKMTVV